MQKDRLESLLSEAKQLEKKYEWLQAAEVFEKACSLAKEHTELAGAAELCEKKGFCYFKAAFQADSNIEFNERMNLAAQTYEKTAALFQKSKQTSNKISFNNSMARVAYAKSWIEVNPSKKQALVDEWWALKSKVLEAYEKIGSQIDVARTCNDMLQNSVDCHYWVGKNNIELRKTREELISLGERAITILSRVGDEYELARAYCWTSYFYFHHNSSIFDSRKERIQRGLAYSKKALELSQKSGDAWLIGWSYFSAGYGAGISNDSRLSISFNHRLIEQARKIADHYLLGIGQFQLVWMSNIYSLVFDDPDESREVCGNNVTTAEDVIRNFQIINMQVWNPYFIACMAFLGAASIELGSDVKRSLVLKAVEYGKKTVALAEGWYISPSIVLTALNSYSRVLIRLSELEPNGDEKRRILEDLLTNTKRARRVQQAYHSNYYSGSFLQRSIAVAKFGLSKVTKNSQEKLSLLRDAVSSNEEFIKITEMHLENVSPVYLALQADGFYASGEIYHQLYLLTEERSHLQRVLEVCDIAISMFSKVDYFTGVAKSHWRKAKIQELMGNLLKAGQEYELASESYLKIAEKVPQLEGFSKNHSFYMLAWSQIEQAKHSHIREDYSSAMEHYRKAAFLHEKSSSWSYLASNFYAWASMEEAEGQSRRENTQQAKNAFQKALEQFDTAEELIKQKIEETTAPDEKEMLLTLSKASDLRRKYCQARILMEDAKLLDREGKYLQSSESYAEAADNISAIIDMVDVEAERKELKLLATLCQAWKNMADAEETTSSESYLEAATFFEAARGYCFTRKASLWALGNSNFCRGLAAGVQYQTRLDLAEHAKAKGYLKNASTNYVQAGFRNAAEYSKATQRLFDAYLAMNQAEVEADQEKRAKQYQMAESLLQVAAGSFMKAKQPEKTAQVKDILATVREEKALAASLNDVMHAPTITSSTISFTAPTPTSESSVGLESFEHANVQANLIAGMKEVRVGESFCLSVEFVNAGKEPALLTRVEDFVPSGFVVVEKPEIYRLEESCLNMKGKQIAPLKLVEAKVVLQPSKKGVYQLNPRVHYLDENGQNRLLQLKSIEIKVEEVVLADRVSTGTKELDSLLLGGIPEEYAVVLTGPPTDERELVIRNFLEAGTGEGYTSFYAATEADGLENLLQKPNFSLFLCNPRPKVKVPDLQNVYKLNSKADINNLNIALVKAYRTVEKSSNKRICVNIISDVLANYTMKTTRKWIAELTTDLVSKGFTILAVINPLIHSTEEINNLLELFDGEINLTQADDLQEYKKALQVKKLRNQDYIKNPIRVTKQS